MFHFYQLSIPRLTAGNPTFDAIVPRAARLTCTTPAFADLWQQVMGAFPLVFPDTPAGQKKKAVLLAAYETMAKSPKS